MTITEILNRAVHEYNEAYDHWKQHEESLSFTTIMKPILEETAMSLLRKDGLTICPPRLLGIRLQHVTHGLMMDMMQKPGPIREELVFPNTFAALRKVQ